MTDNIKNLREYIVNKKHHEYRADFPEYANLAEEFAKEALSPKERMTRRFELMASLETPVLLPGEKICFIRTVKTLPDCFTADEWKEIRKDHFIHELGYMSNLSPDYERAIKEGLLSLYDGADEYGKRIINAILDLTARYRKKAEEEGNLKLARVLARVPAYGATGFYEALQSFRIIHYSLWLEGNYHNTVGRLDKYMYPYLKADMDKGLYTRESALELLEDFFLSFNKDSDLYPGQQMGDNGQSVVLGGIDENGNDVFNLLSELCLTASRELLLIDPKINLRVSKKTPMRIYELGSELTKVGLGFPQYSNDDVVIEGLMRLGYDKKDAADYVVAACWEFIIPKVGGDVANIALLSFPKVIDICLHNHLENSDTFDEFLEKVKLEIQNECDRLCDGIKNLWFVPSPFMNILIDGGIYDGAKYNNFGFHGAGVATAADSLAVIKKYVYDEKRFTKRELIDAVDADFEGNNEMLHLLRYEAPKMGNNEDLPDSMGVLLLQSFADSLKGKKNCRGGIYRAGTGTAMGYLSSAKEIGASPDGRRKGEPLGTNYSASLFARIKGPFSVISSFTKPNLVENMNGGPLTLEFSSAMFSDGESVKKVAALVKTYIDMGGHQLQLNAVNTKLLKDAQIHPENHRQLIVRIWGWSAYFVELDKEYQDHVLMRQQYSV